jgi:hypothetical protein
MPREGRLVNERAATTVKEGRPLGRVCALDGVRGLAELLVIGVLDAAGPLLDELGYAAVG